MNEWSRQSDTWGAWGRRCVSCAVALALVGVGWRIVRPCVVTTTAITLVGHPAAREVLSEAIHLRYAELLPSSSPAVRYADDDPSIGAGVYLDATTTHTGPQSDDSAAAIVLDRKLDLVAWLGCRPSIALLPAATEGLRGMFAIWLYYVPPPVPPLTATEMNFAVAVLRAGDDQLQLVALCPMPLISSLNSFPTYATVNWNCKNPGNPSIEMRTLTLDLSGPKANRRKLGDLIQVLRWDGLLDQLNPISDAPAPHFRSWIPIPAERPTFQSLDHQLEDKLIELASKHLTPPPAKPLGGR